MRNSTLAWLCVFVLVAWSSFVDVFEPLPWPLFALGLLGQVLVMYGLNKLFKKLD